MNKLHKNKTGFSVIEGLLIVIIVSVIGLTGWYVWRQKDKKANTTSPNTTQSTKPAGKREFPFSYTPPAGWTVVPEPDVSSLPAVTLIAPGTTATDEGYHEVTKGAEIRIGSDNSGTWKNLDEFTAADDTLYAYSASNKKNTTVAGVKAVQYDVSYEGPMTHHTQFFVGDATYWFVIQKSAYDQAEYKKAYDDLLASIKITP